MSKIFVVMTENDVEGRSTTVCGVIKADTEEQAKKYLEVNPETFEKYYSYYLIEQKFVDATGTEFKIVNTCVHCDKESNTIFCPDCGNKIRQVAQNIFKGAKE